MSLITIPFRKRNNPSWLKKCARFVGDYRYYRSRGYSRRAAWWNAKNTI